MLDFVVFVVERHREGVAAGRDSAEEIGVSGSDNPCEKGESDDGQEAAERRRGGEGTGLIILPVEFRHFLNPYIGQPPTIAPYVSGNEENLSMLYSVVFWSGKTEKGGSSRARQCTRNEHLRIWRPN